VKRSEVLPAARVDPRASVEEKPHDVMLAAARGEVQRRVAALVNCVQYGRLDEEEEVARLEQGG